MIYSEWKGWSNTLRKRSSLWYTEWKGWTVIYSEWKGWSVIYSEWKDCFNTLSKRAKLWYTLSERARIWYILSLTATLWYTLSERANLWYTLRERAGHLEVCLLYLINKGLLNVLTCCQGGLYSELFFNTGLLYMQTAHSTICRANLQQSKMLAMVRNIYTLSERATLWYTLNERAGLWYTPSERNGLW